MDMLTTENSFFGILLAFGLAVIAAILFPAENQSKIWVKLFGSEWGTIGQGRVWTFLSVLIVVALLWGFLRWIPSSP